MKTFRAALFDLDGTLIDSEKQYSVFWTEMGKVYQPDKPDFAKIIKGTTLTHILDTYFPDEELQERIVRRLYEYENSMDFSLVPGAAAFLADLKAHGIKSAVVTSSNRDKMRLVYNRQTEFMQLFDEVLTSEDFSESKPSPCCYLNAAAKLHAGPDECVVFEDAFNGIHAGRNAGMFVVGLATENSREQIAELCDHVIDDYVGFSYDDLVRLI